MMAIHQINGNQIHPTTLEKVWVFFGSRTLRYDKVELHL